MTNEYGLEKLQKALLEILVDIDKVCRKNDIKYSLLGGTLLGAVREKGFIPWDDDADICFERKEYEKFMEIYPKEKKENYVIDIVFNGCSLAVINPDPTVFAKNTYNIPGPWVTFFVADNAPNNKFLRKVKVFLAKTTMGMMGKPIHYKDFGRKTKILFSITALLGKPFSKNFIRKLHTKISKWGNKKDTKYVSMYNIFNKFIKILYNKNDFDDYVDVSFEGVELMAMSGYHNLLTDTFGDYMTPPPENERILKHL